MPSPPVTPSFSAVTWITVTLASLLIAAFCVHLWPQWLHNPDLSHGLFAPVLFVLLMYESRRGAGVDRYPGDTRVLRCVRTSLLVVGVAFVSLAGIYAAAIEWSHALVSWSLALALSALLLAGLLWLSMQPVRALPFNWTNLVAVSLWPLCVPIPPGTYSRLTLQLQFWVTDVVVHSLHLLGIAASTSGNIILLTHTSVGVEEACSGVRSLLSCVVAALFFSATLVSRPWPRLFLIALAPFLAFGMNVVRSLGLTLLANAGIDITGPWHDVTGYAVLGITTLLLGALALWLRSPGETRASICAAPHTVSLPSTPPQPRGLLATYTGVMGLLGFFILTTHGPINPTRATPDLAAILPAEPGGWDVVRTDDLYPFASVLETTHLAQRTYVRNRTGATTGSNAPLRITIYLAYWSPGAVPVSLVASHTPDACWPGSGWLPAPVNQIDEPFHAGNHSVAPPEYRAFTHGGLQQNVWYWHLYDGRSIAQADPRSAVTLFKLAMQYGFRTAGDQLFVRISSNRPWSEIGDEPLVAEILGKLKPFGL